MPRKTCRWCTPESSKNLILLSICYSITFTLAWVIVSLFKYYAYFSRNYLFSASPYVIVIVNFRNCFRSIVLFRLSIKIFFFAHENQSLYPEWLRSDLVSMVFLYFLLRIFRFIAHLVFSFAKLFPICVYLNSVFSFVKICSSW